MKINEKDIPVNSEPFDYNNLLKYCCPSASWGDMTGLIPYSANGVSDMESYNEVYPYLPDDENGLLS